jgi:hypothetical protein
VLEIAGKTLLEATQPVYTILYKETAKGAKLAHRAFSEINNLRRLNDGPHFNSRPGHHIIYFIMSNL